MHDFLCSLWYCWLCSVLNREVLFVFHALLQAAGRSSWCLYTLCLSNTNRNKMEVLIVTAVVGLIICIVCIFLHITALYLLWSTKFGLLQRPQLIALSIVDLVMLASNIIFWFSDFYGLIENKWMDTFLLFVTGVALYIYVVMMLIIVDKFLSIFCHLRYQNLIFKRKLRRIRPDNK